MKQNRQYYIDLWIFIACITVLLYLLFMNIMQAKNWNNAALKGVMELITVPIFTVGAFIPLLVIFRIVFKKTESKSLAMLTMLFSLLTAVLIGYTTLL